jgi:manganese transport protein
MNQTSRMQSLGPGLVFALGSFGARDLISNSMAGATFGLGLIWVPILAVLARYVILDASARYVLVSGDTLLSGIGGLGKYPVIGMFLVTLLRRHVSALTKVLLLGVAADLVLPLPTEHSVAIWAIASWCLSFAMLFWGRYQSAEWVSRPLAIVMALSLVGIILLAKADLFQLMKTESLWMPLASSSQENQYLIAMAVFTAAIGSISNLSYSAYVHEKGWTNLQSISKQKRDLVASMAIMGLLIALIQIAAASVLHVRAFHVQELDDITRMYSEILGVPGRILFGLILWCGAFAGSLSNGSGQGILLADTYHRFVAKTPELLSNKTTPSRLPAYRWSILFMFVSPLYVFFTDWGPIELVFFYGLISLATLPVIILIVLRLTSDPKRMGVHVNSAHANLILLATVFFSLYVGWQGFVELLGKG